MDLLRLSIPLVPLAANFRLSHAPKLVEHSADLLSKVHTPQERLCHRAIKSWY